MGNFLVSKGIQVTEVELLTSFRKEEARSFTYRVTIRPEDYDKALCPDVWPHRVSVRLFSNKRRNGPLSWAQQSSQSNSNASNFEETPRPSWRRSNVRQQPPQPQLVEASPISTQNRFLTTGFETEVVN